MSDYGRFFCSASIRMTWNGYGRKRARPSPELDDYNTEFRVIWPDASLHVVAARAVVLRDDRGAATRMIGACWDITDTKQREQLALLGSEVGDALTSLKPIQERLQLCVEGLVHQLDAALARIWTSQ